MLGNAAVVQPGGPSRVINQTLRAVATHWVMRGGKMFGAKNGWRGLLAPELKDLSNVPAEKWRKVGRMPSSALGFERFYLTPEICQDIVRSLRAKDVHVLFAIGGNGSAAGANKIAAAARDLKYELSCILLPKTIDNDLVATHFAPGYPSAAEYVARAAFGLAQETRSSGGYVTIVTCMGRLSGFLTAATAFCRGIQETARMSSFCPNDSSRSTTS